VIVVDGSNVRGSVPDGWWRDRDGAMQRLAGRLQCLRRSVREQVVLVLDVAQPDLGDGEHHGIIVVTADRPGRNAADDRILAFLDEHVGEPIEVVTSDRALAAAAVERRSVRVSSAGTFLRRLDELGC
jgi:hypothetical protein